MNKGILPLAGLVAIAIGTCTVAPHCSRDEYQVVVTGTERITGSKDKGKVDSKYVVFTKDTKDGSVRVFENTDSLLEGKFDSSDVQGMLEAAKISGQVCDVKAYGWRIPFFSTYQNVVEVNCSQPKYEKSE